MSIKRKIGFWKDPVILLTAIGISNIGAWIYLIALNLNVLAMTDGSAFAVAGLYVAGPIAALCTNGWSGSLIDRLDKRMILIVLDIFQAALILLLPFADSLWTIYLIVFVLGIASSIYSPTSMVYTTMLLRPEQRKKFNAFRSLVSSGAFVIGPAVAGILLAIGTPATAIFINTAALLISGLLMFLLPRLKTNKTGGSEKISWNLLMRDLGAVKNFSLKNIDVTAVFLIFSGLLVMATALDSLEAAFSLLVLGLSEKEYGFLVSIAGAGIAAGSVITAMLSEKLSVPFLMGAGAITIAAGYIIYAFSETFLMAAIGFFVLSFALAFANTGFQTFYQENIPVEMMGRIGSVYGMIEAFFIIFMTLLFGFAAQLLDIQFVVVAGTFFMLFIAAVLCIIIFQPVKLALFQRVAANDKEI